MFLGIYSVRDTSVDWEKLAKDNAYWAVLTEDQFRGEPTEETLAAFFASGEENVSGFLRLIQQSFPDFTPPFETVVDFGCGAGRLLIPMARLAQKAYGVDISSTMRELATTNGQRAGVDVTCVDMPEVLVREGVKADWVSSYIVLQHIEPRRGYFLINDLLQCVKPGGVATLHIPMFKTSDRADYFNDRVRYFRNDSYYSETVYVDRDTYDHPDIQMFDYDANTVLALFHKNQMTDVRIVHDGASTGIHAYFFVGRRGR